MIKTLLNFLPILLFFIAYRLTDIYTATIVLMAASVAEAGIVYAMDRKLSSMAKITLGAILVFGAITLILHDEVFIKWKPTVLYAALAVALGIAVWVRKRNFLKSFLGEQLELPDAVWQRLNVVWIAYCGFMAVLNGYVAAYFSTDAWVSFKVWGYVFPLAFIIGQGFYIAPHLKAEEPTA